MDHGRNYTLDAMRGVAALMVVLFHSQRLLGLTIAPHGYLAVDLFYVLSGYVIAKAYDGRIAGGLTPLRFTSMRLLRFYPLYALGLMIGLIKEVGLLATHNSYAFRPVELVFAVVLGVLFIPFPYRDPNLFPLNNPSWSLFFELLINIAYVVALVRLDRRALIVVTIVSGLGFGWAMLAWGTADLGAELSHVGPALLRTSFSFTIGLLMARSALPVPRLPASLLLAGLATLLLLPHLGVWYDMIFVLLLSPLLVAAGTAAREARALVPSYAMLGALSFPIYAIHRPVLTLADAAAKITHLPGPMLGWATIAALVLICPFMEVIYDRPARRLLNGLFFRSDRVKAS